MFKYSIFLLIFLCALQSNELKANQENLPQSYYAIGLLHHHMQKENSLNDEQMAKLWAVAAAHAPVEELPHLVKAYRYYKQSIEKRSDVALSRGLFGKAKKKVRNAWDNMTSHFAEKYVKTRKEKKSKKK